MFDRFVWNAVALLGLCVIVIIGIILTTGITDDITKRLPVNVWLRLELRMNAWIANRPLHDLVDRFRHRRRIISRKPVADGAPNVSGPLVEMEVRFASRRLRILTRRESRDAELVDSILWRDGEYRLPAGIEPKVIFDIGANIGVTALYYSTVYPNAEIYCFEPLPENLALLLANAKQNSERIHVFPFGLSDRSGLFDYHLSADLRSFGGGGFSQIGHNPGKVRKLALRTVSEALSLTDVKQVDVFKIDTEGSEWPILQAIPHALRAGASAMIGELHGQQDWRFLELLSQTHSVGVNKAIERNCFPFVALRRDLVGRVCA